MLAHWPVEGAEGDVGAGTPGVTGPRPVDVGVVRVLLGGVRDAPVVGQRVAEIEQHRAAGLRHGVAELLEGGPGIELRADSAEEVDLDGVDLPVGELPRVLGVMASAAEPAALAAVVGARVGVDAGSESALVQIRHQGGDAGGEAAGVRGQPALAVARGVGLPAAVEPDDVVTAVPEPAADEMVGDRPDLLLGGGAEAVVGVPAHVRRGGEAAVVVRGGALVDGLAGGPVHGLGRRPVHCLRGRHGHHREQRGEDGGHRGPMRSH